jgi:hypothetical protein
MFVKVGPHLSRGMVALSFFEKRENKGFFGLLNSEEKVYFERWRISVLVNENPLPRGSDPSSEIARTRIYDTAREQVKERMLSIFEVRTFQSYHSCCVQPVPCDGLHTHVLACRP